MDTTELIAVNEAGSLPVEERFTEYSTFVAVARHFGSHFSWTVMASAATSATRLETGAEEHRIEETHSRGNT